MLLTLVVVNYSCKTNKELTSSSNSKHITEPDQQKFTFIFIEGCKERMKGNIELAENKFKECLKIDPSSAAVKYELANIYKYNRLYDIALKLSKDCANSDPKNEWYQLLYIECLNNNRQFNQAADIYTKLIANFPNRSEFLEGLAAEYMYCGNYEKSFKTYNELENQFGQNEAFTLNKIKLLRQLKKINEAESELKKLIQLTPNETKYYNYLAEFYLETNQPENAKKTYEIILKIDPKNPVVHLSLADYYKNQGDQDNFSNEIKLAFENPDLEAETKAKILASYYELSENNLNYNNQAFELCNIALKLHPSSADIHTIFGDFLLRDKKLIDAQNEYYKSMQLDKSRFSIWQQLMYVESELHQDSILEIHSTEAIELFPNNPLTYYFNAVATVQLKKYATAIKSLETGIEYIYNNNPLLLEFYSMLGNTYNYIKDFTKSDKAYDDALKIDSDNAYVLNNYAYYLSIRKERLNEAEKFSKRSNELSPNNSSFMDTYGWILYQQGKYTEAEIWINKALNKGAKGLIIEHYGDVLFKLNKKDEALKYWKEAKNSGGGTENLDKKITEKKLND